MTLGRPWVLLLIPAIWVVAALYWRRSIRTRQAFETRWTQVALVRSSVPSQPGWLMKYGAFAALVIALHFVVFQLAEPLELVQEEHLRGDVSIAVDGSRTMRAVEPECEVRFDCAVSLVERLLPLVPEEDTVSLVSFDSNAKVLVPPTLDRNVVKYVLEGLKPGGNTSLESAIQAVLETTVTGSARHLLVFSDGNIDVPAVRDVLDDAVKAGLRVSTVLVGTQDGYLPLGGQRQGQPVFSRNLEEIANVTGGIFAEGDLPEVRKLLSELDRDSVFVTNEVPVQWPIVVIAVFAFLSALLAAWRGRNRHLRTGNRRTNRGENYVVS